MTLSGPVTHPSILSDELAYVSAHDLAARVRRREVSPVEVIDAFIARTEACKQSSSRQWRSGINFTSRMETADCDPRIKGKPH
jgi:Asp-tRNA(Asn)/Glu-tRNA(Gln) amidotransferase A subunit family amidase